MAKGSDKKVIEAADYCFLDTPSADRLSKFERLTLVGGAELDRALAAIAAQFSQVNFQTQIVELDIGLISEAAQFYSKPGWLQDPASFFVAPQAVPTVREVGVHGLSDGQIIDLSFPSSYQVQKSDFENEYRGYSENLTVHARMWKHSTPAPATMVTLHGWSMGDQRLNSLAFLPGVFYQMGLDVVMLELPYHGRRTPKSQQVGSFFPSGNLPRW